MQLLSASGARLALLETVTGGEVAGLLRATPAGAEVITGALTLKTPAEISTALHVSLAKIEAFGLVSEMVAAEAAASLIDTYEGGWGLALLGNLPPGGGVNEPAGEMMVALGTPSATIVRRTTLSDALYEALDLLHGEALARVQRR